MKRAAQRGKLMVEKVVDAPPPPRTRGRPARSEVPDRLLSVDVGECIDLSRSAATIKSHVHVIKKRLDSTARFIIRDTGRPGWSRVWRVS